MGMRLGNMAVFCGLILAPITASAKEYYLMIGPMFHCNLGGTGGERWSFGVEGSYWSADSYPFGIDVGAEYVTDGRLRLYSELEAGVVYAGMAAGPVLEVGPMGAHVGLQGSAWVNFFGGVDCRVRKLIGTPMESAPGFYAKVPQHAAKINLGPTESDTQD